jgi:3-deoxy-D-manno-octulosonate 8-phosphate phosphatase (KDO 8-P phosphatase)
MKRKASSIRVIVSDVDGVWTSGNILYYGDGREMKEFNIRDGLAVKIAQKAGIEIAVLTSRSSRALERRCRELGINRLTQGASDKLSAMSALVQQMELTFEQVLYIGDDLPDLAPIRVSALSAAPSDAAPEVLAAVTWKLHTAGGKGALREAVELLLKERGDWPAIIEGFRGETLRLPRS